MATEQNTFYKKSLGFYISISAVLLCIAAAITYGVCFRSISYKEPVFNLQICILLIVSACISVFLLINKKLENYAPVLICIGSGISFLMYIKMIIWPVSDTIYGIEPFPYMNELILCTILFLLSFIFSEVSLYMGKSKEILSK